MASKVEQVKLVVSFSSLFAACAGSGTQGDFAPGHETSAPSADSAASDSAGASASVPSAVAPNPAPAVGPQSSATSSSEFPVSWSCANLPEPSIETKALPEIIRSPSEGQTLAKSEFEKKGVVLSLPRLATKATPFVAIDHFSPRPASVRVPLTKLFTEWDSLTPGPHRLVVFWLDARGLVVRKSPSEPLVALRHFQVSAPPGASPSEAPKTLPLADWLWVSPAGTLNGAPELSAAYPRGLSLVYWGDDVPEITLHVEGGGRSRRAEFGPASCELAIAENGDFRFVIARGEERVERTVSVNLDLVKDPAK